MASEQLQMMSIEEYFELEESHPDTRYEYLDGYIYMMSGGTLNHAAVGGNVYAILKHFLRGKRCHVYNSDPKVRVSKTRYFHPDVTVTCDPHDRGTGDLLQYPRVVFEVLSPSTELIDRTWKLQDYLALPTLEEYILVGATSLKMELYRKEQTKWVYYAFGPGDELELASVDLRFPLAQAYVNVDLEEDSTAGENDAHLE